MAPANLIEQTEAVARAISDAVRRREGRLVAVTVTRPPSVAAEQLVPLIQAELVDFGLDFVDIGTREQAGPIQLLGLEFER